MSRLRVSESQARLLFGDRSNGPRQARPRKRREDLPENQLISQLRGFLEIHGWTVTRQQVGLYVPYRLVAGSQQNGPIRPIYIGERGAADWRCEKPIIPEGKRPEQGVWPHWLFYLETKAPGGRIRPEQLAWARARQACGTPAVITDSLDAFREWYAQQPWSLARSA
jgi:hypothetical protein